VPNDASQINFVFNNGAGSWDNNNNANWNVSISGSCSSGIVTSSPCTPVHAQAVQIFYNGSLASSASSITMHWGYNGWNGVTDTVMTKTSNGVWTGFAMVPSSATGLNMAFVNQSGTWDNNNGQNYNLTVS
jgi:Starch/carbohydrate-binding module (family 53)